MSLMAHHVVRGAATYLVDIGVKADIDRHGGLMAQSRPSQLRHYLAARMTIRKRENILILLGCTSCPMDQANYHV
jgi:hypothetical protein